MHSWKSSTSKEANKLLSREGEFWEPEYYDHLIRSEEEFHHYIEYVASNPKKARVERMEVGVAVAVPNLAWVSCPAHAAGKMPTIERARRALYIR